MARVLTLTISATASASSWTFDSSCSVRCCVKGSMGTVIVVRARNKVGFVIGQSRPLLQSCFVRLRIFLSNLRQSSGGSFKTRSFITIWTKVKGKKYYRRGEGGPPSPEETKFPLQLERREIEKRGNIALIYRTNACEGGSLRIHSVKYALAVLKTRSAS